MTQLTKNENPNLKQLSLFDLEKLEKRILDGERKAREGFIEIGTALDEIITRRGYLQRGFKTPEEYCEKHLKFSLRHGQRYIAAARAAKQIERVTGETPRNEAAARVLTSIASDEKTVKRVEAELKKSKTSFAQATAEIIQEVVAKVTGKSAPSKPKDEPAPTPTLFVATSPTQAAQAATRDECPHCHSTPQSYVSHGGGWHCGKCEQPVAISIAVAVAAKQCPECEKPITPGDDFCAHCGAIL